MTHEMPSPADDPRSVQDILSTARERTAAEGGKERVERETQFEVTYRAYHPKTFYFARLVTSRHPNGFHLAEEGEQDAWVEYYLRTVERGKEVPTYPLAYVKKMVAQRCHDLLMKDPGHQQLEENAEAPPAWSYSKDTDPSQQLVNAMRDLAPRQREAVATWMLIPGITIPELAEEMRIGKATARTHFERGKEKLARRLPEPPARPMDQRRKGHDST
ncbi:RNA polymerase sigma factor [Actinomadura sp. 9N215]|uniref:RNA polymerase sigma factor n=1 Tax=Actinomadura sp. 9N215 TaxID=3375150 RepID=UPI0037A8CE48